MNTVLLIIVTILYIAWKTVKVLVTQSCPTLCNHMDCSLTSSSVRGIFQARILEWIAIVFSEGFARPQNWTPVSCIAGSVFTVWVTGKPMLFSCSVVSNTLLLQQAGLPCPSPSPRACSDSCPLSRWCHPTISSSVVPFPPAFSLSQHQDLFQCVGSLHPVAKVLKLQYKSFKGIFRVDFL